MHLKPFGRKATLFYTRPPERDAFINVLWGSIRSGKTTAMMLKLIRLCRYKVEGKRVIIGQSKQTVYNNILTDLFAFVDEHYGRGHYEYNRSSGAMSLFGIQWLIIGAKDEGSERYIRGMTVGVAYIDEATLVPESFFMMLLSRMSPDGARMYATTNPGSPIHYLKTRFLDNVELLTKGKVWGQAFLLTDNPGLSEEKRADYHAMYTGFFYRRFILGEWVGAEGAIYAELLDDVLFDDNSRPVGLMGSGGHVARYIGVDYGTSNPCVFLDIYDDGRTLWQVNEYYYDSRRQFRQKTDAEYADDLEAFIGTNRRGTIIVVDPSAASFKAELQRRGLPTKDADNDVLEGIRHTASLLSKRQYRIHVKCENTRREMASYAWDEKAAARGEEKPIKEGDHAADSLRYICKTMIPKWRLAA